MAKRVVILGGGVGGLSAAHELIERGFEVEVFELRGIPGGKARSMPVAGSGKDGRKDLPGEHGFRFFPGFYQHLPDTMRRIPFQNQRWGVLDNLVDTTEELMGAIGKKPFITLPRFPHSISDFKRLLKIPAEMHQMGLTDDDLSFFAGRFFKIITSCWDRRVQEYERIPWWDFIGAAQRSVAYQRNLAIGMTRTLVACKAEEASTKTIGDVGLQLLFNMVTPGMNSDRLLNGPTNDVWIQPWLEYLVSRGVVYHFHARLDTINCVGRHIESATVKRHGKAQNVHADYFISALPVEVMAHYLTEPMLKADSTLAGIQRLGKSVAWMAGMQFYLKEDVPIVRGHEMFLDTPWALTSISQKQFWPGIDLAQYADGKVRGILSVDISEWDLPGDLYKKAAKDCTGEEIAKEVWTQLQSCLNVQGTVLLRDDNIHSWFIDPDIYNLGHNPSKHANAEPLLVNTVGAWPLRPEAYTGIENLFLASDYVRTHTDLACMEGANEAARRAVNAIIDVSDSNQPYCKIWPLHEPDILIGWRKHDAERFRLGMAWQPTGRNVGSWLGNCGRLALGLFSMLIHFPGRFIKFFRR